MLPDLPRLLAGYELFAKRNGFRADRNEPALEGALDEAAALARGSEVDEPAALFFALARRPRAFGREHGRVVIHFTVEHARGLGLALTVDVSVLELRRARVVRSAIDFAELRGWLAAHLAPIARQPWPPKS
jgi:hypothetical protein